MMRKTVNPCLPTVATLVAVLFPIAVESAAQESAALMHAKALSRAFRHAAVTATPAVVTVRAQVRRSERYRAEYIIGPNGTIIAPANRPTSRSEDDFEDNSVGSGVIIDSAGMILTNSHVLGGADRVLIELSDGQEFVAGDIKRDPASDVAMIWIKNPPANLPAAELGDSNQLETGDWVMAIGSPFELEATVSAGIISGKGRGITKIRRGKLLQTDAAINPGNSGGPLVDLEGKVVGINTAIASNSGGYQGIGFAIPINHARWVVNQLNEYGEVRRSFLGVNIDSLTPKQATKMGLPAISGVFVKSVTPDTPASAAGLRVDDVIVEFAGTPVRDSRDLQNVVERKPVGSQHNVKIYRNGKPNTIQVVMEKMPDKVKNKLEGQY